MNIRIITFEGQVYFCFPIGKDFILIPADSKDIDRLEQDIKQLRKTNNLNEDDEEEAIARRQAQQILMDDTISERERCTRLYKLGYSRRVLIQEFGLAKATVYDALPVRFKRLRRRY